MTPIWTKIKRSYVKSNRSVKLAMVAFFMAYFIIRGFILDIVQLHNPLRRYMDYNSQRGMHIFYDWIDWIGGYPFETAKPEEVIEFFRKKGFILNKLKTQFGCSGCNEYVFQREV